MRMRYFGDSYDIVKQSLVRWMSGFGPWFAHPMFTHAVSPADVSALGLLLDATVVSTEVLTLDTDRPTYFDCCSSVGNLFLDPDTGLRMRPTRGVRAQEYLFASELLRLAERRPKALTVVFDQSVRRGSEQLHLEGKLRNLRHHKLFGFAYISHACFLVVGEDRGLIDRARSQILDRSHLPESRLLPVDF